MATMNRLLKVLYCWSRIYCFRCPWYCLCFLTSSIRSCSRYLLPSGVGVAIILADFAEGRRGPQAVGCPHALCGERSSLFLVISPVWHGAGFATAQRKPAISGRAAPGHIVPPNIAVVAGWQEDFAKLMRFAHDPLRFYFLLDWPVAVAGPRGFVLDYHLMHAYRDNGYYSKNIQESQGFLCSHWEFFVLDAPNANTLDGTNNNSPEMNKPDWFDNNIRIRPEFGWKVVGSFDGPRVTRKLISVHRNAPLPFVEFHGRQRNLSFA